MDMPVDATNPPSLHTRLERQLNALLLISRRWRWYEADLASAFKAITETAAAALAVERVSIWLLDDARQAITCQDLYENQRHRHTRGFKLLRRDHPEYFTALESGEIVDATDAHHDPRTRSFRDGYLVPHGIGAMLDTPVRVGGRLTGVLCHEHVGQSRLFLADEQSTAAFLANKVSLACEIQGRLESEARAERALGLFAAAVESAGIAVFAADLKGDLFYHNDKAKDLYNFPDDLLTRPGSREERFRYILASVKNPDSVGAALRKVMSDPAAPLNALRIDLKDGRTIETSSRPHVVGGKIVGRVWTAQVVAAKPKKRKS